MSDPLAAAYIFDLPDKLGQISWSILLKHAGSFKNLEVDEDHLPANSASKYLRNRRFQALTSIVEMDARSAKIRLN